MLTIFNISFRNILRNLRRSLITIFSIVIGIIALLFLWGFNDGQYNNAIENFPLRYIGSFQIHKEGFFLSPKLDKNIKSTDEIIKKIDSFELDAWSVRLNAFALVAGEKTSTGMSLVGIDPQKEKGVSILDDRVIRGRFINNDDSYTAIIGFRAAKKLNVDIGDDIILLSNDSRGAMTADKFTVVGIVSTGDPKVDQMTVFVPLLDAQTMLAMEGKITDIIVQVPNDIIEKKINELEENINDQSLEFIKWYEISSLVKDAQTLDAAFALIFMFIVVIIVISGIANTVLLSMMQRTKEFGILLALGAQRSSLALIIAIETLVIGLVGTVIGTSSGLLLLKWLSVDGINIMNLVSSDDPSIMEMILEFGIDPIIYPTVNTDHLLMTIGGMLIASLLSGVYPIWRAISLEPIEAVRHV